MNNYYLGEGEANVRCVSYVSYVLYRMHTGGLRVYIPLDVGSYSLTNQVQYVRSVSVQLIESQRFWNFQQQVLDGQAKQKEVGIVRLLVNWMNRWIDLKSDLEIDFSVLSKMLRPIEMN